jgi:membrane associated rhomboid family serine protease
MNLSETPVTIALIILNVVISIIALNNREWMSKALMWPYGVKRYKQFYRFISSGFIHADYVHLFFNMFTLFFFGRSIEYYFSALGLGGTVSYLLLYFLALVLSDLPTYFRHRDDYHYHSLGASGAVSAVVFATVLFDPWASIYIYGAIKLSALLYAVLYIIYCVVMAKKQSDNINHDAHLWGALFGIGFTVALIAAMQPQLFEYILGQLKNPSLFGRN